MNELARELAAELKQTEQVLVLAEMALDAILDPNSWQVTSGDLWCCASCNSPAFEHHDDCPVVLAGLAKAAIVAQRTKGHHGAT